MANLRLTGCRVDTQSITISFSEKVLADSTEMGACNPGNYRIFAPTAGYNQSALPDEFLLSVLADGKTVMMSSKTPVFTPGDWVQITVANIALAGGSVSAIPTQEQTSGRVPGGGAARITRDAEDAISYPILTEEIGYRQSPVGMPAGGGGSYGGGSGNGSNNSMVAMRAVSDVLGWKPSSTDPRGFVGALTQSFNLTDVEGHVESTWVPRTYAVQTDLGGGISGAQASLYTRAKDALDQSLQLLDGLYPLDPDADPEYVNALREMARSQMNEIVKELGTVGLPSILRIDTYFDILLGQHPTRHFKNVEFNPDKIGGTLGKLRATYGIYFRGNPWNNSVKDEEDITNFRVISDYMTSLLQSWIANREFFVVAPNQIAFFGTQLVLISRQLNVIAETVNEVRFTLDSVFIGPNERQTLLLEFRDRALPAMFLEDMLVEIEDFVTEEGPRLLRDGGKISVTNNILPVVKTLHHLVKQAHDPENKKKVPDGFRTARVRRSLDDLQDQLRELTRLTEQVEQSLPVPEYELTIDGVVIQDQQGSSSQYKYWAQLSIYGSGFEYDAEVSIHSQTATAIIESTVFYSAERIDINLGFDDGELEDGDHDIRVTNPGPDAETAMLRNAFSFDSSSTNGNPFTVPGAAYPDVAGMSYTTSAPPRRGSLPGNKSAAPRPSNAPRPTTIDGSVTQSPNKPAYGAQTPVKSVQNNAPEPVEPALAEMAVPETALPPAAAPNVASTDVFNLHKRMEDLQDSHKSFSQEVRDKFDRLFGLVEGKNRK